MRKISRRCAVGMTPAVSVLSILSNQSIVRTTGSFDRRPLGWSINGDGKRRRVAGVSRGIAFGVRIGRWVFNVISRHFARKVDLFHFVTRPRGWKSQGKAIGWVGVG